MVRVQLEGLSFGYGGPIDIVREASVKFETGWTGIVGENGSGKSTLLSLIAEELIPTRGRIRVEPAGARVLYARQSVDALSSEIRALAESFDKPSLRWQARLKLEPSELDRWPTLSPGERRRWQIGAALAAMPDVLLLDEPTNHIDAEARALIAGALRRLRGVGLLVSHDRDLLDELTETTIRMHRGELRAYPGSYRHARALWEAERVSAEAGAERADRTLRAERRRLAEERRRHAASVRSTRTRAKGPRDADARSMARKFAAQKAEARRGREVGKQVRAVARADAARAEHRLDKERGKPIAIAYGAPSRRWIARLELDELRAGPHLVAADLSISIERESRVRIAGRNGAGKSTLLERLAAAVPDPSTMLHVPQELDGDARRQLARELTRLAPGDRGELLQLGAALGLDPDRVLASTEPSPGEARKLLIARGLARRVGAMLLDEPTNHLDLPSIERLERALAAFPGALVLVSHDDAFANALTDTTWRLDERRLQRA